MHRGTINDRNNKCIHVSYVSHPVGRVLLVEFDSPFRETCLLENNNQSSHTQFTYKETFLDSKHKPLINAVL